MRRFSQLIRVMLPLFNFHQHPHFTQYYSYCREERSPFKKSGSLYPKFLSVPVLPIACFSCKLYIVTEWMTYEPRKYKAKFKWLGAWLMSFEIKTKNSFSVPVKRVSKTSSPVDYYPDTREMELKCTFKGWPRPRVVWYNPDKKQIINGSEGFYITEKLDGEDTLRSLLRNLNIQEKHKGDYNCTATNNNEQRLVE